MRKGTPRMRVVSRLRGSMVLCSRVRDRASCSSKEAGGASVVKDSSCQCTPSIAPPEEESAPVGSALWALVLLSKACFIRAATDCKVGSVSLLQSCIAHNITKCSAEA
jgi:hypothetical protein